MSRAARYAESAGVLLGFVVLAAVMTWPLAVAPGLLPDSDDAYFSVWRLAWVAHQLPRDAAHLFDARIFFPAANALAFSDAMLMVGTASAPLFWAGVEPVRIHNLLLVLAFAASMIAAYALARRLTGDRASAVLAAVIFGLCPYRFAHIGHLELQWVVWMPLGLLALHRLFESPSWRPAVSAGAAVAAQTLCSIYYGVFLAVYLLAAWGILAVQNGGRLRLVKFSLGAALPLLVVIAIYAPPYARARATMGPRSQAEISQFSASPSDYLQVSPQNRLQRLLGLPYGNDEHSLFPGFIAVIFAVAALWPPVSRLAWLYGVLAVLTVDASLGPGGVFLGLLGRVAPILTSLRSSARFAVLTMLSMAVLAALSSARLNRARKWGVLVTAAAILLAVVESAAVPISVRGASTTPSDADRFLQTLAADTVVIEMPVPSPQSLWLYETTHQLASINHWRPMVNGYSGFVPPEYAKTLEELVGFPDERSARRLRDLGVDMVVVNRLYYDASVYQELGAELVSSPYLEDFRRIGRGNEEVIVVQVRR